MMKMTTETATVLDLMAPSILVFLLGMPEALQSARYLSRLQTLCLEAALPVRTTPSTHAQTQSSVTGLYSWNLQTLYFSMENFSLHTSLPCTWETPRRGFTYGSGQSLEPLLGISISSPLTASLLGLPGGLSEVNWPDTPCNPLLCVFCSHFLLVLEVLRHTSVPVTPGQ